MKSLVHRVCQAFAKQFYGELRARHTDLWRLPKDEAIEQATEGFMKTWDWLRSDGARHEVEATVREVLSDTWHRVNKRKQEAAP